jgi:CBS-domain-containing membrane protein
MSAAVRDFMNPQLVYMREGTRPEIALRRILDFEITAVPVLDDDDRPAGLVSLRDLADERKRGSRVTQPVLSIGADESIAVAAAKLVDSGVHHLVVVDAAGRAVGMLSAVDVIRALVGARGKHPTAIEGFGRTDIAAART